MKKFYASREMLMRSNVHAAVLLKKLNARQKKFTALLTVEEIMHAV